MCTSSARGARSVPKPIRSSTASTIALRSAYMQFGPHGYRLSRHSTASNSRAWAPAVSAQVVKRQFRFLYDLAREQSNRATYELRFVAQPSPNPGEQVGRIDIVFLGKVFVAALSQAAPSAAELWSKFLSHFPLEDPFNYPVQPVLAAEEFRRHYAPLPFDSIDNFDQIVEIRRFEEMPISDRQVIFARSQPSMATTLFTPLCRRSTSAPWAGCLKRWRFSPTGVSPRSVSGQQSCFRARSSPSTSWHRAFRAIGGEREDVTEYLRSRAAFGARDVHGPDGGARSSCCRSRSRSSVRRRRPWGWSRQWVRN